MSDQVFLMPDLGEGLSEAVILEWRVKVGDPVDIDQIVVEVETAKATVEVPIPFAGTVTGLHGEAGATVEVGKPLIAVTGLQGNEPAGNEPAGDGASAHGRYREEEEAGSGNVLVGYGTSADSPRRRQRTNAAPARAPGAPGAQEAPSQRHGTAVRVISPVVRALARTNGIELTDLAATVPGGVITRADVERATASRPQPTGPVHTSQDDRVVAISGFRKAVADKLSTSRREIPDATTWVDVDASALFVARAAINAAVTDDEKVSLMALLARLTIAALRLFPELNSTVDTDRNEITYHGAVHLGVATQTPRGLMVPVIHNAGEMSTVELGQALKATTELARNGKLGPDGLSGGTFTLNNYGVFGVDGSTPIINHPEAAILGVGRIIDKPWVYEGALSVRKVTQLSLSFDHRVCDGGTAGGFLRLFADFVENPVAALGRI